MSSEREAQKLSADKKLLSLIDLGVRDAKDQPDAPAITIVSRLHGDLLGVAFDEIGLDFSGDVNVQSEVFRSYLLQNLSQRGRTSFNIRTKVFEDKRTREKGFYVFLVKTERGS